MRKFLLLFVASIFTFSCKKDSIDENSQKENEKQVKYESTVDAKQGEAELRFSVYRHNKSITGDEEVGANVSLFKKREDAINNKNKIITATTNLEGKCKFIGLKKGEYFVRVDGADCYSNLDDLIKDRSGLTVTSKIKGEKIYDEVIHIYQTATFQIFNDLSEKVKIVFDNQTAPLAVMSSKVILPKSSIWFSVNKSGTWGYSKQPEIVIYKKDKKDKYSIKYKSLGFVNIEDLGCEGKEFHIN